MKINKSSGTRVANAIENKTKMTISQKVSSASFNKTEFGRIVAITNGSYTVLIKGKEYPNIMAYESVGELKIGDAVDLLIPNNRFLNIRIIGKIGLIEQLNSNSLTTMQSKVLWTGYWDLSQVNSITMLASINNYTFIEVVFEINENNQIVQKFGLNTESSPVFGLFSVGNNTYWANIIPNSNGLGFTKGTTSTLAEGDFVVKQIIGINQ